MQLVALADPTPRLAARRLTLPAPELHVVSIYRRRNAATLLELLESALRCGSAVSLWALDQVAPSLARWTAGSGPGTRFALANRLLADRPPSWCVVADDDVRFRHGDVVRLVRFAQALGLDIAQPAHALGSHVSHSFTRRAPFRVARRTSFVEIGPVVVFGPLALPHVLPLPEEGMGWGTEAAWAQLGEREGLRLGIVDAVTIRHLQPPGGGYAAEAEREAALARLQAAGKQGWGDLQRTHGRLGLRRL